MRLPLRRRLRSAVRRYREARLFGMAMRSARHPVLAHIVPIRRCNLSCSYCNEFDSYSAPVPVEEMISRIERLAALGTTMVTISGGEPLLHPDLEHIVQHIRRRGIIATLITNGTLLTREAACSSRERERRDGSPCYESGPMIPPFTLTALTAAWSDRGWQRDRCRPLRVSRAVPCSW
jgi:uncharacterized radical SAM superfamily Fe-S cluster-containing enzyme